MINFVVVFTLIYRRHLTLLIMIFFYTNCIIMAYVELHMIGLETI